MTILHIQLTGPYTEGMSYQENILPKYHAKLGHDVYFIAINYAWNKGRLVMVEPEVKRINEIVLIRVEYKRIINKFFTEKIRCIKGLYRMIEDINPQLIMLHDIQSVSHLDVVRYLKKNNNTKMIVDCHADFSNSATSWMSRHILHRVIWRHMATKLLPYTEKFYGTLPAREEFLSSVYGVPRDKIDLLVMGIDDEKAVFTDEEKKQVRESMGINDDEFLIITGGKIDYAKRQTLLLMESINRLDNPKVKLVIFGSVDEIIKEDFFLKLSENCIYIGWLKGDDINRYISSADLAIFPGRHSVIWEQTVGLGVPMVVKDWNGTHHVDIGGNVVFLKNDTIDEMNKVIEDITQNEEYYYHMKEVARQARKLFLYSSIAKKSLECIL